MRVCGANELGKSGRSTIPGDSAKTTTTHDDDDDDHQQTSN